MLSRYLEAGGSAHCQVTTDHTHVRPTHRNIQTHIHREDTETHIHRHTHTDPLRHTSHPQPEHTQLPGSQYPQGHHLLTFGAFAFAHQ
jgi:hypothetical protein